MGGVLGGEWMVAFGGLATEAQRFFLLPPSTLSLFEGIEGFTTKAQRARSSHSMDGLGSRMVAV